MQMPGPEQIKGAAEALGALIAVTGAVLSSPLLITKARLAADLHAERVRADRAEKTLASVSASASALAAVNERLDGIVEQMETLHTEIADGKRLQKISVRYIAALIRHIRSRGTVAAMPAMPPELTEDVDEQLRADDDADAAILARAGLSDHASKGDA